MSTTELKTRIPRTTTQLVDRPRLRDAVTAVAGTGGQGRVLLVTGPPGAGKTTLLAEWARRTPGVAWVTLDERDDADTLWPVVLAALVATSSAGTRPPLPPSGVVDDLVAAAVELMAAGPEPVHLVLDEVENLTGPALVRIVDLLLRWMPSSSTVVLVGRREPPLALGRVRLEGRLHELRAADLAFTPDETDLLLAGHGMRLSATDFDVLMSRTEGWAAGLRLMIMSLEATDDPIDLWAGLGRGELAAADYLVGELLARLPVALREFLLATCVCDVLTPELAARLSGRPDAGDLLEQLCRANALTFRLDGTGRHYRYHRMLRAHLSAELMRRDGSATADLHQVAAQWFDEHGEPVPAVRHAGSSGRPGVLAGVVERLGPTLLLDGHADVLRGLPPDPAGAPAGILLAAAAALEYGEVTEADRICPGLTAAPAEEPGSARDRALDAMVRLGRAGFGGDLRGPLQRLRRVVPIGEDDVDVLALVASARALRTLGDLDGAGEALDAARVRAAGGGHELGVLRCRASRSAVLWAQGDPGAAMAEAEAVLSAAAGGPRHRFLGIAHLVLGFVLHQRLQDDQAAAAATAATELLGADLHASDAFAAAVLRSVVAFDRGAGQDDPGPYRHATELRRIWAGRDEATIEPGVVAFTALALQRMSLAVGEPGWARATVAEAVEVLGGAGEAALLRSVDYLHHGRADLAGRVLHTALAADTTMITAAGRVQGRLLEAVLEGAAGRPVRAHEALRRAVEDALPHGITRPFHSGGRVVRDMLTASLGRFGRSDEEVRRLLPRLAGSPGGPTETLSVREAQILHELPSMRTAEEIAADLGISVNTVRTHLRNLYRKLEVSTRREAVAAGRRQSLL